MHEHPSRHLATSVRLFYDIKHLTSKGHDITLLAFRRDAKDDEVYQYCKKVHSVPISGNKQNILGLAASIVFGRNFAIPTFDSDEMHGALKKALDENEFDAIVTTGSTAFYVADLGIPKIVYAQDAMAAIQQIAYKNASGFAKKISGWLKYLALKKYEARRYPMFDRCIVLTQLDAKMLAGYSPHSRIELVPLGLDTDYFSPEQEKEESSIVYLGDMSSRQNIDPVMEFAKDAYRYIKRVVPNVKFYIVGRNPSDEVLGLSRSDSSIIVTGEVPDIRPYLRKAAVVISPSKYELGIKNKVMIGMSMGKAVVTTEEGVNALDVNHGEHLLIAKDSREFADYVVRLLQDPSLRSKLGNKAREYMVSNNSTFKSAQMFEALLHRVMLEHQDFLNAKKMNV
jgi:glycosyltransferase involved in cell wall biosynthesis